jgi:hypothetical protein
MIAEGRLEENRIRMIATIWAIAAGLFYCYDILRDTGTNLTANGRPLGDDYVNFWSGPFLAWNGRIADVYNWPVYHAFQQSAVGNEVADYLYAYPPVVLVLTAPLALLPYVPGLGVWIIGGWLCFWRALRLALSGRDGLLLAAATPAVFINAVCGQNGTWTAAFFGGGLCLLQWRPFVAGMLFGLLIYKPQLGLLIPIAFLAGRQWWAIAGAIVSAGFLLLASLVWFGPDAWQAYLGVGTMMRQEVLEQGAAGWNRMISVFAFARTLGADMLAAYAMQAAMALIAAVVVAFAWLRDAPMPIKAAALVLGTCLATPYLQDYDMVVGAFVVVWLMRPEMLAYCSERAALIACGLILTLPLLASPLQNMTGLVFGPLFLLPGFMLTARATLGGPMLMPAATAR